jgi:excisionase family DNA binding protein
MSVDRDESFLTVAEVAELLKVNQQTVRNWIDHGKLAAVRVGRRVRIKRSDLNRILETGNGKSTTPSPGRPPGPSAEDFWSGEPVGVAEPDPAAPSLAPADPEGSDTTSDPSEEAGKSARAG